MANTYKVLGQSNPSATTSTTLYTCPSVTQTVVSVITVANRSATPTTFRVSIDVNAGGDSNEDYIAYDVPIGGNQALELGKGLTLDAADLIRVYAGAATLSFGVFGQEIT